MVKVLWLQNPYWTLKLVYWEPSKSTKHLMKVLLNLNLEWKASWDPFAQSIASTCQNLSFCNDPGLTPSPFPLMKPGKNLPGRHSELEQMGWVGDQRGASFQNPSVIQNFPPNRPRSAPLFFRAAAGCLGATDQSTKSLIQIPRARALWRHSGRREADSGIR